MAMGVPCVVTDVGDAAMLVGQSGVIVPKEDAGALARGMEQLAGMGNDARRRLGALGRARIQSEFSMTLARSRFEALYRSLLVKEQG
jgi:glycosyltransferase involved in cell wall biosynthesis